MFVYLDFSVTKWLADNGIGNLLPTDNRWNDVLQLLFQVTGMDKYFINPQCRMDLDEETTNKTIQNGWINGKFMRVA